MVDLKVTTICKSDSKIRPSYVRYLGFGEQGSKAPERPSTYWASSYTLKFILWFNLLKRERITYGFLCDQI